MVLQIKKVVFPEVFNLLIEMYLCFSEILHVSVLCELFLDCVVLQMIISSRDLS